MIIVLNGIFNENYKCDISLEELEVFYQILQPLYKFSNLAQKTDASIMVVFPSILLILNSSLPRLNLKDEYNVFRNNLIYCIQSKSERELNSDIYLAAAVLNTGSLHLWYKNNIETKRYFCIYFCEQSS